MMKSMVSSRTNVRMTKEAEARREMTASTAVAAALDLKRGPRAVDSPIRTCAWSLAILSLSILRRR